MAYVSPEPLSAAQTITRVETPVYCATRFLPWIHAQGEKPGSWKRSVVDDERSGLKVDIRRPDPGLRQGSHGHPHSFEQLYVLGGDFTDAHHSMRAGDYVFRKPGVPHGSVSYLGAEILVVFNETHALDIKDEPAVGDTTETHILVSTYATKPNSSPWSASVENPDFFVRQLHRDLSCGIGASTLSTRGSLRKVTIGSDSEFTQVLVLSGDVSDGSYRLAAGDYLCIPPGTRRALTSESGVEILRLQHRNK